MLAISDAHPASFEVRQVCKGYEITNPKSGGTLCSYVEEFRLWVSHNKLTPHLVKHFYTGDLTAGTWHVRHSDCSQEELPHGQKHCDRCAGLGSPRGVQRCVLRFVAKYHAAVLLQKRLFFTVAEADEYKVHVGTSSAYGQRHAFQWDRLANLSNMELQAWVRSSWHSVQEHSSTPTLDMFFSSVVTPCLRVNPTCIDSRMNCLFSGFVQAICDQSLTVAGNNVWECFGTI